MDDGETATHNHRKYDDPIDDDQEPISQDELRVIADDVRTAFPRPLTQPELVLIDVDPRHLYAFWNLPLSRLEAARAAIAATEGTDAPMVLRLAHDDGEAPFDIEVQGLQGQTYVDIWDEYRRYRGALGLRLADGSLAVLIEGGEAALPPLAPVPLPAATLAVEPPAYGRTSPRGAPRRERVPAVAATDGHPPVDRQPIAEPFPPPPGEGSGGAATVEASAEASAKDAVATEHAGAALPIGGEEPAWPAVATAGGAAAPLELENALTLSSFVLGRETVQLEVNAELRVFGRARPGSELRLFGRRVSLRPDGSFSITRPLPNGALVLTALLAGGEGD